MANEPKTRSIKLKTWGGFSIVGLVAIAAGIVSTQLLASAVPQPAAVTARDTAEAGSLQYTPPVWPEGPDSRNMLLRLGLGTAVVLVLCVGMLWASKRWLQGMPVKSGSNHQLAIIETLPLGNRCWVHLLRAGKQQVLVGLDGSGMKAMVALPERFEQVMTEAEADEAPQDGSAFAETNTAR